jgi:hypothetical protein
MEAMEGPQGVPEPPPPPSRPRDRPKTEQPDRLGTPDDLDFLPPRGDRPPRLRVGDAADSLEPLALSKLARLGLQARRHVPAGVPGPVLLPPPYVVAVDLADDDDGRFSASWAVRAADRPAAEDADAELEDDDRVPVERRRGLRARAAGGDPAAVRAALAGP